MAGIWVSPGKYVELGDLDHKGLMGEVATSAAIGEFDAGGALAEMPDPDPVLRKRGDDAKVLDDLIADDQVMMAMSARKLRVLNNRDYDYNPGVLPGQEASKESVAVCEELTKDLETIRLIDVFSAILDAPFYGFSVLELMWEADGGRYRLADIKPKPREWFTFAKDGRCCLKPQTGDPKPLPEGKFIVVRHFPTHQNPYGLRLLSRCLWPVAFKRGGIKFWTRFLDRYGMPWPVLTAPPNTSKKRKQEMAATVASMMQDAVLVLQHGAGVELIQSKGTGGLQFEKYLQRWDKAISKVLMGQTLSAEMDGQGGSRAAAEVHKGVADDISEADQGLVCAGMDELAAIYRAINKPGAEASVFGFREPEDHQAQARLDKSLHGVGVRFSRSHFERRYNLQPDEFEVDGIEPEGKPGDAGQNKDFAEGKVDHQDILDAMVSAILPQAAKANEAFVGDLLALLGKADSYEEISLLLAEHLGKEMGQDAQEDLMADLLAASAMLGRAAVAEEADGD